MFGFYCRARDSNTTAPLNSYNISFWVNDTYIMDGVTNSSGWAGINFSIEFGGAFALGCNATSNGALFYDSNGNKNYTIIAVNDTEAPRYYNLATSATSYTGSDWEGNASWADNTAMGTVLFESNFTGNFSNYSTGLSGSDYYFQIKGGNLTVGKNVAYRWIANDTTGNQNVTSQQTFAVTDAPVTPPSSGGGGGGVVTVSSPLYMETELTKWFQYEEDHRIDAFSAGSRAYYYFAGENHTIKAVAVTKTTATLIISSTPYNVTLTIGETRQLDLNNDGTADLMIKLNGISGGNADLTFSKVAVPAETPSKPAVKENVTQENKTVDQPKPEGKTELGVLLLALGALLGVFGLAATRTAILKIRTGRKRRR